MNKLLIIVIIITNLIDNYLIQSYLVRLSYKSTTFPNYRLYNYQSNDIYNIIESKQSMHSHFNYFIQFANSSSNYKNSLDLNQAANKHLQSIVKLVRSDLQQRDDNDIEIDKLLPIEYIKTIVFIDKYMVIIQSKQPDLYKLCRLLMKEEGLKNLFQSINSNNNYYMTTRDIVESKRKIERLYSSIILISISYYQCRSYSKSLLSDYLYFIRVTIEHTASLDRHFAIIYVCRGIFQPPYYKQIPSIYNVLTNPFNSLYYTYINTSKSSGLIKPSTTYRLIYPILLSINRFYDLYHNNSIKISNDTVKSDLQVMRCLSDCESMDRTMNIYNSVTDTANGVLQSLYK